MYEWYKREIEPVPAHRAMSCHNCESIGVVESWYIPMVAATRGTLSMRADAKPISVATMLWSGMDWSITSASDRRIPAESNAAMYVCKGNIITEKHLRECFCLSLYLQTARCRGKTKPPRCRSSWEPQAPSNPIASNSTFNYARYLILYVCM